MKLNKKSYKITKPTKANIRTIIENYLNKLKNIYILDLFAGTGKICFNLNSEKIKKKVLIEKNKIIIQRLEKEKKFKKIRN